MEVLSSPGSAEPWASTGWLPLRARRAVKGSDLAGLDFDEDGRRSLMSRSVSEAPWRGDWASLMASSMSLSLSCLAASSMAGQTEAVDWEPPETGALGRVESPQLDVDEGGVEAEEAGGSLGHDGVHAGAEVLGAGGDVAAAVGKEADDGHGGGAVGGVGGGGHAVADVVVAFEAGAGGLAFGPAEALGGLL